MHSDESRRYRAEVHFGQRVVESCASRPSTLYAMAAAAASGHSRNEALVDGAFRATWDELLGRSDRLAQSLQGQGISPGDRVVLFLSNRAEFIILLLALNKFGGIAVPIGIREQAEGLSYILRDCDARAILYDEKLLPIVAAATYGADVIALGLAAGAVDANLERLGAGGGECRIETIASSDEDAPALLLYTSGTTGQPKGVIITNFNIVHAGLLYASTMGLGPSDRGIIVVPLTHVTGIAALVANLTSAAGAMIILSRFDVAEFLETATCERMTYTILVPAMYNLILARADLSQTDLSSWRIGGYGGAPMPVATVEALSKNLPGLELMNCYGATETVMAVAILPSAYSHMHSDCVGLAVEPSRIKCIMNGCEVPSGEPGELWISGPTVSPGYWANVEATKASFVGGFWRSGDIGSIDSAGFVRVLDRMKDMINRGGYKIYSAEVENVLMTVEGVLDAAIVGTPCPVLGERVAAFIVPDGAIGTDSVVSKLRATCAAMLADYKCPERYEILGGALPRNANGKVMKAALRERLL